MVSCSLLDGQPSSASNGMRIAGKLPIQFVGSIRVNGCKSILLCDDLRYDQSWWVDPNGNRLSSYELIPINLWISPTKFGLKRSFLCKFWFSSPLMG